jgi:hypothetical protein
VITSAARKARLRRRRKISAAKRAANRCNARRSTGPRTAAGKARSAQNARRHGLTSRSFEDPALLSAAADLAQAIMGTRSDAESRACAMSIARAQIRMLHARLARRDLYDSGLGWGALTRRLASLFRHERRARSRRKFAIRAFDASASRIASRQDAATTKPNAENFGQNEPPERKAQRYQFPGCRIRPAAAPPGVAFPGRAGCADPSASPTMAC